MPLKRTLCITVTLFSMTAFATALDQWTILPGFVVDGETIPAQIEMTDAGLKVTSPKVHYGDTGDYQGIILNTPVDVNDFSLEFSIDELAGLARGVDIWIGIHLLNQKEYFSVGNPAQSQGLVTLFRPYGDGNIINAYQHVSNFGWAGDVPVARESTGDFKYEFKYNTDETYSLFVDGTESDVIFDNLNDVFTEGKAYLAIGVSTNNGETTVITIKKINGVPVSGLDISTGEDNETQETSTVDQTQETSECCERNVLCE